VSTAAANNARTFSWIRVSEDDANVTADGGNIRRQSRSDNRRGEELTHDWAMTDHDNYRVECQCGPFNCRRIVTGKDWQLPELQKRYCGYFSAYLARKIAMNCHSE